MLTENRWIVEEGIMAETFPHFWPWRDGDRFGFEGYLQLKGKRPYEVVIEGSFRGYPSQEPVVFIHPRPENHHWIPVNIPLEQRHLCYQREENPWQPARSTFASCLAVAVSYLRDFG